MHLLGYTGSLHVPPLRMAIEHRHRRVSKRRFRRFVAIIGTPASTLAYLFLSRRFSRNQAGKIVDGRFPN
jgi:hypothetical protein